MPTVIGRCLTKQTQRSPRTLHSSGVGLACARTVLAAVRPGGTLILSGLLSHERGEVCAAFGPAVVVWEREEDGWIAMGMKKP